MKTKTVQISDKAIRDHRPLDDIFQLKDSQEPLIFRYHDGRKTGSYYLVKRIHGKNRWIRLGSHPEISTTTARKALSIALQRMMLLSQQGQFNEVSFDANHKVLDILMWYLQRSQANQALSIHSQKGIKSVINCHLVPTIGQLSLKQLSRQQLDTQLLWPLQQQCKPATVKQVFQILKRAFKTAHGAGLISENPMMAFSFNEFVSVKISAKPARLTVTDLPKILVQTQNTNNSIQTLTLLMLLFGTRVGETSQAKWEHFDKRHDVWRIPSEHTKTGQAHRLPITPLVWQLLKAYKQNQPVKRQRSPWLFSSGLQVKKSITAQYASQQVSQLAQGQWSAHDLRKLARTAWLELDIDYVIGEFLLNHQLRQVDKAYIQTFADVKCREAMTTWHQYLLQQGFSYRFAKF